MQPEGWDEYPWPASHTPATDTRLVVRARVLSPQLRNYRDLLVAIPPSGLAAGQRYPVIYLQDGQNLFDPATSYVEPWGLLAAMDRLAVAGTEALVVGIPNHGRLRRYEYSPFRDILHGGGGGDRYLAFLLETVKPLIDRDFPTRPGPGRHASISISALRRAPRRWRTRAGFATSCWRRAPGSTPTSPMSRRPAAATTNTPGPADSNRRSLFISAAGVLRE
jgi:predicted alpha/beta superfamily hydrolase